MVVEFYVSSAGVAGDSSKLMYAYTYVGDKEIKEHTMFNSSPMFFKNWYYRRAQKRLIKQIKKHVMEI